MYRDSNSQENEPGESERRHPQTADLFEQGVKRSKVAEVLGVTRKSQPAASGMNGGVAVTCCCPTLRRLSFSGAVEAAIRLNIRDVTESLSYSRPKGSVVSFGCPPGPGVRLCVALKRPRCLILRRSGPRGEMK